MLVGGHRVPRLGAGVEHVEQLALPGGVVARLLVALGPVGVLDGDFDVRVGRPRRGNDILFADPAHQIQPVGLPAAIRNAVGGIEGIPLAHAIGAGAVGEEEVVDDEFVEVAADEGTDLLQFGPHDRVVVTEGVEQALLRPCALWGGDNGGQPAGHLDAVGLEDLAAHLHLRVAGQLAPPGLQVHLVQAQVFFKESKLFFQLLPGDVRRSLGHEVGDQLEIAVIAHG